MWPRREDGGSWVSAVRGRGGKGGSSAVTLHLKGGCGAVSQALLGSAQCIVSEGQRLAGGCWVPSPAGLQRELQAQHSAAGAIHRPRGDIVTAVLV